MGGAKPPCHHEVSLKAPVLAATRIMQDHIAVLARNGARAYANVIRSAVWTRDSPRLTEALVESVAAIIEEEGA